MAIGIAVRDDAGITHWAPYSEKSGKSSDTGRRIVREFGRASKPRLALACEGWNHPALHVNQVRRVSTRVASVTCMTCILRM